MAALASLIPELEDAIHRGSPEQRARTLQQVAGLFLQGAAQFTEEHVQLFDDVLSRLVVEIETQALAELASRLAPVANAPIKLLRRLARDNDITVAGPVLLQSRRLEDIDLVDIALSKSQAHLLVISSRPEISAPVTDILISRGDRDVVRNVANNNGAKISDAGYAALVSKARTDNTLAERVGQRADIPPHLFQALIVQAAEVVRQKLLASARPETREEIRRILAKVAEDLGRGAPKHDFEAARRSVLAMHEAGRLGEPELAQFAKAGQFEETVASLSVLCGVPVDIVDRLMAGDRPDPILIMCKAIGFDWSTVRPILLARPEGRRMSPTTIEAVLVNFDRLSPSTAERVLRFWQSRQAQPVPAA